MGKAKAQKKGGEAKKTLGNKFKKLGAGILFLSLFIGKS